MSGEILAGLVFTGIIGFIGWLVKSRFDVVDNLSIRVNTLETKVDILGDINKSLAELKTDVEIIKSRLDRD